jgi:hypothetical protein
MNFEVCSDIGKLKEYAAIKYIDMKSSQMHVELKSVWWDWINWFW